MALLCILGAEGCVVDVNQIGIHMRRALGAGALQGAIRIDRNLQCVYIVCGIPINLQQQNKDFVFKAFRNRYVPSQPRMARAAAGGTPMIPHDPPWTPLDPRDPHGSPGPGISWDGLGPGSPEDWARGSVHHRPIHSNVDSRHFGATMENKNPETQLGPTGFESKRFFGSAVAADHLFFDAIW